MCTQSHSSRKYYSTSSGEADPFGGEELPRLETLKGELRLIP